MIRLYRILPLLVLLAVIAAVVYLIMSFRYSSERAKAVLIRVFTWLCAILSVAFGIITVYALFEHNDMRWIRPSEIPEYTFCPADYEFLGRITDERLA